MRALFVEWSESFHNLIAEHAAREGWEVVGWTGDPQSGIDFSRLRRHFPEALIVETERSILPPNGYPSPSGDFSAAESAVLKMMNRMDYTGASIVKRKEIFRRQLAYWNAQLDSLRPELVVFSITPHMTYDYVISELCRSKGIRTLEFSYTRFPGRVLIMEDFRKGDVRVSKASRSDDVTRGLDVLSPDIRDYFRRQTSDQGPSAPTYMKRFEPRPGIFKPREWARKLRDLWPRKMRLLSLEPLSALQLRTVRYGWERKKAHLRAEYVSVSRPFRSESPFVYLPLHYQPERSSCPLGGVYADQYLLAQNVSAALPPGWRLVIKEHPRQLFPGGTHAHQGRELGFYRKLASLRNVDVVPMSTSSRALLDGCRAVATLTGTAGWEGLFLGKPALVFGYAWYRQCPGVEAIDSLEDCRFALAKLAADPGARVEPKGIERFLAAIDRFSICGYVDRSQEDESSIPVDVCAKNIFDAIASPLTELENGNGI